MDKPKKLSLAAQIFIALVLAVIAGLLMQSHAEFAATYIKPFGTIFLNLVKFIVGPIVLFSIMAGVVSMRDIRKVGQIGGMVSQPSRHPVCLMRHPRQHPKWMFS